MANKFGELLRKHRKGVGLTQQNLAEKLAGRTGDNRCSFTTVSRWESGIIRPPDHVVEALEEMLLVPKGTLLGAAGYREAAYYRKATRIHRTAVLNLIGRFKAQIRESPHVLLGLTIPEAHLYRDDPVAYEMLLAQHLYANGYRCETRSDGKLLLGCSADRQSLFSSSLMNHLADSGAPSTYQKWRECGGSLLESIAESPDMAVWHRLKELAEEIESRIEASIGGSDDLPGECPYCPRQSVPSSTSHWP